MNKNKVFPILVLFILTISLISFAQEMNTEAGKLYNEGNSQLKAGNYNGAISNYDKALAIEKIIEFITRKVWHRKRLTILMVQKLHWRNA